MSHNQGNINFLFIADSSFSNDEKIVLVEISSTSESIEPLELEFKIKPNRIIVEFEPPTISADDTALIKIKYKDIDGIIREFQGDQLFLVSTNAEYGYFLYKDEITGEEIAQNEILYKKLPLKFVAKEDIPYPFIETEIRVITYIEDEILYGKRNLRIKNRRINAYFEKEPALGDTIEVKVNLIDSEGNIKELPDTTHFEVGIKEGCEIGKILTADGSKGDYFFRISKPIRFIVNDSVKVDSNKIVIRVGIAKKPKIEGPPILIGKVVGKVSKSNKKRTVKKTEDNYCSVNEYIYERYGLAEEVIKKKDCSSAPQCEGEVEVPEIKVNVNYRNGYMGINFCQRDNVFGYFYPLITDSLRNLTFDDYEIEACYNINEDRWQVSVIGNEINIRVIKDICLNNIYRNNRIVIENVDDIKNRITKESAWQAFVAFYQHLNYPPPANYLIREFVEKHEDAHLEEFIYKIIPQSINPRNVIDTMYYFNNTYYKNYTDLVKSFNLNCSDYDNIDSVIISGRKFYRDVNELLRKIISRNFKKLKKDEFELNYSIRQYIKPYQDKIIELFPEIKNENLFDNFYIQE